MLKSWNLSSPLTDPMLIAWSSRNTGEAKAAIHPFILDGDFFSPQDERAREWASWLDRMSSFGDGIREANA